MGYGQNLTLMKGIRQHEGFHKRYLTVEHISKLTEIHREDNILLTNIMFINYEKNIWLMKAKCCLPGSFPTRCLPPRHHPHFILLTAEIILFNHPLIKSIQWGIKLEICASELSKSSVESRGKRDPLWMLRGSTHGPVCRWHPVPCLKPQDIAEPPGRDLQSLKGLWPDHLCREDQMDAQTPTCVWMDTYCICPMGPISGSRDEEEDESSWIALGKLQNLFEQPQASKLRNIQRSIEKCRLGTRRLHITKRKLCTH